MPCPTCGHRLPTDHIDRYKAGMRVRWLRLEDGWARLGSVTRVQHEGTEIVVTWDDESIGIYDAAWFDNGRATIEPIL